MDPGRLPGIDLRQATLSRVFGGPAVPPWPFVFRCARPPHTTERMGQWHAKSVSNMLGVSSQAQGARRAPIRRDIAIQRRAEEMRGGFNRSAHLARTPKSLARNNKTGCGRSGNGISAAEYRTSRLNQHHLAEPTMNRDDVLVWLSLAWFVALCGAAIWVLFPL